MLDVLLLLSQQWLEGPTLKQEGRAEFLDTSWVFGSLASYFSCQPLSVAYKTTFIPEFLTSSIHIEIIWILSSLNGGRSIARSWVVPSQVTHLYKCSLQYSGNLSFHTFMSSTLDSSNINLYWSKIMNPVVRWLLWKNLPSLPVKQIKWKAISEHSTKPATSAVHSQESQNQHQSNLKIEASYLSPSPETRWHLVKSASGVCSPSIPSPSSNGTTTDSAREKA